MVARAGASAAILNRGPRPLSQFDPDLVGLLVGRTRSLGVEVLTKHTLLGIERRGDSYTVRAGTPTGEREFVADLVVHSAGRVPALAGYRRWPVSILRPPGLTTTAPESD